MFKNIGFCKLYLILPNQEKKLGTSSPESQIFKKKEKTIRVFR